MEAAQFIVFTALLVSHQQALCFLRDHWDLIVCACKRLNGPQRFKPHQRHELCFRAGFKPQQVVASVALVRKFGLKTREQLILEVFLVGVCVGRRILRATFDRSWATCFR